MKFVLNKYVRDYSGLPDIFWMKQDITAYLYPSISYVSTDNVEDLENCLVACSCHFGLRVVDLEQIDTDTKLQWTIPPYYISKDLHFDQNNPILRKAKLR